VDTFTQKIVDRYNVTFSPSSRRKSYPQNRAPARRKGRGRRALRILSDLTTC
jgi:hypothetical protein